MAISFLRKSGGGSGGGGGSGLSQSQVDSRVRSIVFNWAEERNSSTIPNAKIHSTIARVANVLSRAGGTLTGALTLSGAPTADLHAATKKYVDDNAGGSGGGGGATSGVFSFTKLGSDTTLSIASSVDLMPFSDVPDFFLLQLVYTRDSAGLTFNSFIIKSQIDNNAVSGYRHQVQGGGGAYFSLYRTAADPNQLAISRLPSSPAYTSGIARIYQPVITLS